MISSGKTVDAIAELKATANLGRHGRLLLTMALNQAEDWAALERHLASPESAEEMTLVVTALVKQKQWPKARDILKTPKARELLSQPNITLLQDWIRAEEGIAR